MTASIKKDMFFTIPKPTYLFVLLGVLALIPNYPSIVSIGYSLMAIYIMFSVIKETHDLEFSATLPVSRDEIVKARIVSVLCFEGLQFAVTAVCAVAANLLVSPDGNLVGLDLNPTFFGVALLCMGVFNAIFFPWFYKTGYKSGLAALAGILGFLVCYGLCELAVICIPGVHAVLDTLRPAAMGYQAIVLGAGAAAFAGLTWLAVRQSCRNFASVNL